jgi:hypothetical protein
MLNGKYISSKYLIDSIIRDYGFRATDVDFEAMKEHIYDVMMLIGAPTAFTDEVDTIAIADYRAELPCGLIDFTMMRVHGTQQSLIYSSDRFYMEHTVPPTITGIDNTAPYVDQYSTMPSIMNVDQTNRYYTYYVNDGYIFTNFQTGALDIVYKAFPMDSEGYPEIPDDVRYLEAVRAYCAERIGFKQWMKGELTDKVYQKLEQDRLWYIASAGNSARIPNLDQMESLKHQWLTLIPNISQHQYGFRYLNRRQRMRTGTI